MTPRIDPAFDLDAYMYRNKAFIDQKLIFILKELSEPGLARSAMKHSVTAGGKRIRPILCVAAFEAVAENSPDPLDRHPALLDAACAIEMIHTYSLIHDDLPAMDDDDLRRGKPSCHAAFGEAAAILAGDALLTHAFEVLSSANGGPGEIRLEIIRLMARAAGSKGMIQGQILDIQGESRTLSLDEIERVHRLKTGAMIEAAVCCGALLGGGNADERECLRRYASKIGLAFQVTDDILNVTGDPREMGKPAGSDEKRNKSAYPSLMGIEKARALARRLVDDAFGEIRHFDARSDPLRAVARRVIERNK
jgi:geranylgeranyl diphosphate synthase, type II